MSAEVPLMSSIFRNTIANILIILIYTFSKVFLYAGARSPIMAIIKILHRLIAVLC